MRIRFSMKELFLSATLIGVGTGMLTYLFGSRPGHAHEPLDDWQFVLWFASGVAIGAGIFIPFKKPIAGASLGLIVQIVGWLSMGIIWT